MLQCPCTSQATIPAQEPNHTHHAMPHLLRPHTHHYTHRHRDRATHRAHARKMPPAVGNGRDKAKGRVLLPRNVMPLKYDLTLEVDLERCVHVLSLWLIGSAVVMVGRDRTSQRGRWPVWHDLSCMLRDPHRLRLYICFPYTSLTQVRLRRRRARGARGAEDDAHHCAARQGTCWGKAPVRFRFNGERGHVITHPLIPPPAAATITGAADQGGELHDG